MRIDFFSVFTGAFSLMKKPLKFMPSVYANSELLYLSLTAEKWKDRTRAADREPVIDTGSQFTGVSSRT